MADYNFREIERKWQKRWQQNKTFKTYEDPKQPKYYVLDMFPYPSGAGLHVGHPLGYIGSDIVARYKRQQGYNVLHPMGFDAFGLPAEQYAVQTGQHPKITTENNINRYKEQLNNMGFSYDWSREVHTCDPGYYKWTQWIFLQLFKCWYNKKTDRAEYIDSLVAEFEKNGNSQVNAACDEYYKEKFSADEWIAFSDIKKQQVLQNYRLAYLSDTTVNWCPALGTVLANEEVKDGFSERGGHPVYKKEMKQWALRITAYAERLLSGLEKVHWSEALKEMQRNWIGKSRGCQLVFNIENSMETIEVFTTRPDTIFGVTFMTLAPEHTLVKKIATDDYKQEVEKYVHYAANRSERDRLSEVKKITGQFTGAYAIHPFTEEPIPIYIGEYVLAGYGTGAVMAVPSSDVRDYNFARHFDIPVIQVQEGEGTDITKEGFDPEKGTMINSDFLNGLPVEEAIDKAIEKIEEKGIGYEKINYKMRDAIFSRQRYWGEPFPVYFKDDMPYPLDEEDLPLTLPEVDEYKPTESGEPPLARAENWVSKEGYPLETDTMPGWAGSSWYFLRYMDPKNEKEFVSSEKEKYWGEVDLYIGGTEHATGHLLYSRFWYKFLHDLGYVSYEEPFYKLINQGMIQGRSNFVYRINHTTIFISKGIKDEIDKAKSDDKLHSIAQDINDQIGRQVFTENGYYIDDIQELGVDKIVDYELHYTCIKHYTTSHVDVNIVDNDVLDLQKFRQWRPDFEHAEFVLENDKYICGVEVEKMSKSKHNVVNPDDIIKNHGADALRLFEMFLGPLEQSKPWDTSSIDGVTRFLRKLWRLYHDDQGNLNISDEEPSKDELKILHKTIQKVEDDNERYSFNTAVSAFMVCVNELTTMKCNKRRILEDLAVLVSAYAPHIGEELWEKLGYQKSIAYASFPQWQQQYVQEESHVYPVSVNGKMRFKMEFNLDKQPEEIEKEVLQTEQMQKWLQGKTPKKVIVVPKKIVNVVV